MKRFLPLLILLLILSLTIVACGGDEEEPAAGEATTEEEAEEPMEEEAEEAEEPMEEEAEEPMEEMACDDAIGCVEVAPGDPILYMAVDHAESEFAKGSGLFVVVGIGVHRLGFRHDMIVPVETFTAGPVLGGSSSSPVAFGLFNAKVRKDIDK